MSRAGTSRSTGPVDLRLLRLARPARRPLVALAATSLVQAAATVGISLTAAHLVVTLLTGGSWSAALLALAGALAVRAGARAAEPIAAERVSGRVVEAARHRGLATLTRGAHTSSSVRRAGTDPATLLATGLEPLRPWYASYLPALVVAAVLPPAVVVLMLAIDPSSALTVLLTLPLVPLFAALIGWATQRQAAVQYARGGALAGHFLDVVRGLVTLKLYDRGDRQVEEVRRASRRYAGATTRVLSVAFLSSTALDLVATVSVGLVAVGAGVRLSGGDMDLWPALAVILLAPEAYRPLREAGAQFHASAQASAVMDGLDALDPRPDDASGREAGPSSPDVGARRAATGAPGVVEIRGAAVRYPGRRDDVRLPDLSVAAGELVAVAGPSGSGKTTLLRLLAGAERPRVGTVRTTDCVVVPQRAPLPLARTVREALTAGLEPDLAGAQALPDDATLRELLAALGVRLGLDTPLGDDATGISTGQRQRLAVASAVLRTRLRLAAGTPAVLLLDEPTAHLDTTAERAVATMMREVAEAGAAVVVTAHRSALIAAADRTVTVAPSTGSTAPAGSTPRTTASEPTPPSLPGTSATGARTEPGGAGSWEPEPAGRRTEQPRLWDGVRRRWASLAPRTRLVLAGVAGALSALSGIGLTAAASWLIVRAEAQPPILTLSIAVVCVRAFAIARPLWRYLERLASHDAALGQLAHWRAQVVADLLPQVPGRLTTRRGALLSRVIEDVDVRLDGLVRGAVPGGAALGALVALAAVIAVWHPVAVIALAAGIAAATAVALAAARRDRRIAVARDVARTDLRDAVVAAVENAHELAGRGSPLLRTARARGAIATRLDGRSGRVDALATGGAELAGGVLVVGAALTAAGAAAGPPETVGVLVLGSLATVEVLAALVPAWRALSAGATARGRLAALRPGRAGGDQSGNPARCDSSPGDRTARTGREAASGPLTHAGERGGLVVTDLAVGWDGTTVRDGIDLAIPPGQCAEISWPSGAGKSTLAATLTGLVPPRGGRVAVAGRPLEQLGTTELRRRVCLAGDADHVFATTLRENLRLARPDAEDAELVDALRRAHLGPWLDGLADGLDTWFDSGGHALSGGERRRLVLARALLRDPEVLILDEPEAGLDAATAVELLASLRADARARGRALLVLTHLPRVDRPARALAAVR